MPMLAASDASARRCRAAGVPMIRRNVLTPPMLRPAAPVTDRGGKGHRRAGLRPGGELGNTGVVKNAAVLSELAGSQDRDPADGRTRDRVTQLLLRHGWATAGELSVSLGLSSAAIRRHLD